MYYYTVMGWGLTGRVHIYSDFRDLVFSNIPKCTQRSKAVADSMKDRGSEGQTGSPLLIRHYGRVVFKGIMNNSYGSAAIFEEIFNILHTRFFPWCTWSPIYLKDERCHFFLSSFGFMGLEGGINGRRPLVKKWVVILQWSKQSSFEEVEAFCYLTHVLWMFILWRAELVRIMKCGSKGEGSRAGRDARGTEFLWTAKKEVGFVTGLFLF